MPELKILVVQLRQLGDILLTTPCLRAIKKEMPEARLTFLSHAMGRLILDDCPFVDEHFFYDDTWSKMQELRLARTLRARQFDIVFDFMNNPRSAFYTLASGGNRRYAFDSARKLAYTDTVRRPSGIYIVEEKFMIQRCAGFSPVDKRLVLPWSEEDTRPVLHLHGTSDEYREAAIRIVLSPTHRREPRRWPLENYAKLADHLVRDLGAYVSWIHGPGEENVIREAMTLCKEKTFQAPKTTFREMAAFVASMDLFVGNSNGPSHVAVAVDTPSLQLHGPTDMRSWCPLTDRHQALQASGRPGGQMSSISVEAVANKIEAMLPMVREGAQKRAARGPRVNWRQ